ncbi:MAG: sulfatase-like hydrolase/transferase [Bryobacteraceae bacterium]
MKFTRRSFLRQAAAGAVLSQFGGATERNLKWAAPPQLSNPNILFVMVDQMRYPQWMGASQQSVYKKQIIPNITNLIANKSYGFDQYYTCATVCSAARGTLLSGLYAPQTCVYAETNQNNLLLPAYPTWATGMQTLNSAYLYNVWWFGKWHLSICNATEPLKGYAFRTGTYPGGRAENPDPEGVYNEGTNGGLHNGSILASDAEIAGDFINWISGQAGYTAPLNPWCAVVSLINPHDIASAPNLPTKFFPKPQFPPPSNAPALFKKLPSPWNYEDLADLPNKPPLQYAFQQNQQQNFGVVDNASGWVSFLNEYYWLQNYVDTQIGLVMQALANSPYADNTIVVFTADHGEYAGSHGLHDKGDAAYDESIRVPFYVQFPGQTASISMNQMCSSVDMFGFMVDLATGGSGPWRTNYPDLGQRQSIWNFLYQNSAETRVAAALGNRPYIFHTCDETNASPPGINAHVVCLRTKNTAAKPGAKFAVYSDWDPCTVVPDVSYGQDFEFYDYNPATGGNVSELGNDYYSTNTTTQQTLAKYVKALGVWTPVATGLISSELNAPLVGIGTDGNPLSEAQEAAQLNYYEFLGDSCSS